MINFLSPEQAKAIVDGLSEAGRAALLLNSIDAPFEVAVMDFALTTAQLETNPFQIGFPFRSVFVRDASDSTAEISLKVNSRDSGQGAIAIRRNDSIVFPRQQARGFLHWDAQSGKTMQLVFFVSGEFRSGSQISETGGGVAIVDGSAATQENATISATAAALLSADTDRKKAIIVNYDAIDMYIGGDSSVTANAGASKQGLIVPANGGEREWNSTAACYQISGTGAAGTADKISIHVFK